MTAAILATVLFAVSAIFGQRISRMMGGIAANFWRLVIAVALLGILCGLFFSRGFPRPASVFWWLFFSGVIGFGIGDVALFLGYFRIGARLTLLINLCLAPVFGAMGEFIWMGEKISGIEMFCIFCILGGIILALKPDGKHPPHLQRGMVASGITFAVIAGMGQGFGAVITRHANALQIEAGAAANANGFGSGMNQAFVRTLGGLVIATICYLGLRWVSRKTRGLDAALRSHQDAKASVPPQRLADRVRSRKPAGKHKHRGFWLLGAGLAGPVIGVSFFQLALQSENTAIVLAITATSPLIVALLARLISNEKPGPLAMIGSLISVGGVIAICLLG